MTQGKREWFSVDSPRLAKLKDMAKARCLDSGEPITWQDILREAIDEKCK